MRRASATVLCLALLGTLALPAATPAEPTASQTVFTQKLIADGATSASVKRLLQSKGGIVDQRSGFVDVTGDGRQDAVVLVSTQGAAGTVALYVFSTHGQKADQTGDQTSLNVVFRLQSLSRATLRISGTTLSILEPSYAKGDDLCCPKQLRERDYRFSASKLTFVRTADHPTPFS